MRLKSIKPTSDYKQVEFGEMIDDFSRHNSEKVIRPNRVYSPSGWQPVLAVEKIKTGRSLVVRHDGGSLECDPLHRVKTFNGNFKYVSEVKSEDKLVGIDGSPVNVSVSDGSESVDLFDIELPAPHEYFTSGVVSHNSIMLCNNSVNSVTLGYDTLHITFEMSAAKTARRCLGAFTEVDTKKFVENGALIDSRIQRRGANSPKLAIYEMNPSECSTLTISALLDNLRKTKGWTPKILVLDYMDLLMSKVSSYNKDQYTRQKFVSEEVCGLAKSEQLLIYTATQLNRSATDSAARADVSDLNKLAESFGKSMALDYVISLNQTAEEYNNQNPVIRAYIAKNREGEKFQTVNLNVSYFNMKVRESNI